MSRKIPPHFIQELKHSVNIVEIASQFMKLERRGRNHFGLCPFHSEKTPSFSVNDQLQIYHCFGCGKSGDVISLVMELEGTPYPEAVQTLAERCGLTVPAGDPAAERQYHDRRQLHSVMEAAAAFYHRTLSTPVGGAARDYLNRRGITPETVTRFQLGVAPPGGYHLVDTLSRQGVPEQVLIDSGLASRSDTTGRLFDQFRGRLMVPIHDIQGRVVAFGGRALGDVEPKYINSRETPIYRKSHHLFGLRQAARAIRETDRAVLVEGYFDVIGPAQAGLETAVAPLGTSLTQAQVKLLGRFTRTVTLCFDADNAGRNAAFRSLELLLEEDFECRVATLPAGEDPDTYARSHGGEAFIRLLDGAEPFLDFAWRHILAGLTDPTSPKARAQALESAFPLVARLPRAPEQSLHLSRLAAQVAVDPAAVFDQFRQFQKTKRVDPIRLNRSARPDVLESERLLLQYLFRLPEGVAALFREAPPTPTGFRSSNILAVTRTLLAETGAFDPRALEAQLKDDDRVMLHQVLEGDGRVVNETEARNCLLSLRSLQLRRERENLSGRLRQAEADGDEAACRTVLGELRQIDVEIRQLGH